MKPDESVKHFWLYALKLQQDKYYIGITSRRDPRIRIQQHIDGYYGAKWTKKYPPVETMEIIDIGDITHTAAERLELIKTKEFMKQYGYQNVRGGSLTYTGRYIRIFHLIFRLGNFLEILAVLLMMGCIVGLYFLARH